MIWVGIAGLPGVKSPFELRWSLDVAPSCGSAAVALEVFTREKVGVETASLADSFLLTVLNGRLRDNVNRGGEKIGCEEVEGHVSQHPAVSDAKLVAMPDPFYGEKACIFIIPRPGMQAPDVK